MKKKRMIKFKEKKGLELIKKAKVIYLNVKRKERYDKYNQEKKAA